MIDSLPTQIPIFPLRACIVLPGCNLPLVLFEPRYLQMLEDLPKDNAYIGIIQPKFEQDQSNQELFSVGTLVKVIDIKAVEGRRYQIIVQGQCRFHLEQELTDSGRLYRKAKVNYDTYSQDLAYKDIALDRDDFFMQLEKYMRAKKMNVRIKGLNKLRNDQVVDIACQVLPLGRLEKQTLLEEVTGCDRAQKLKTLMQMDTTLGAHSTMPHSDFFN